jgi:hypothetical protein
LLFEEGERKEKERKEATKIAHNALLSNKQISCFVRCSYLPFSKVLLTNPRLGGTSTHNTLHPRLFSSLLTYVARKPASFRSGGLTPYTTQSHDPEVSTRL